MLSELVVIFGVVLLVLVLLVLAVMKIALRLVLDSARYLRRVLQELSREMARSRAQAEVLRELAQEIGSTALEGGGWEVVRLRLRRAIWDMEARINRDLNVLAGLESGPQPVLSRHILSTVQSWLNAAVDELEGISNPSLTRDSLVKGLQRYASHIRCSLPGDDD